MTKKFSIKTLALLMPCASFYSRSRKGEAIVCMCMQATIIGWLPASAWAYNSISEEIKKQRVEKVLRSVRQYAVLPLRKAGSTSIISQALAEVE